MICNKCKIEKTLDHFEKRNDTKLGYRLKCKDCRKEGTRKRSRKYYNKNKQKERERCLTYYHKNKQDRNKYNNNYIKNRRLKDPAFSIMKNMRTRISQVLSGVSKSASTTKLLGCTIEQLKEHLESQLVDGMSFENYGEWHIDHIKPCVKFDLNDEGQQLECFNYTNLQPLWAKDNLSKGAK